MKIEPLGCPFCGSAPTVEPWHGGGLRKHMVGCWNDSCPVNPGTTGPTRQKAVERWNTRSGALEEG